MSCHRWAAATILRSFALNPLVYYPLNESGTPLGGATNYGSLGAAGNAGYAACARYIAQQARYSIQATLDTDNSISGDGNTDVVLPYSSALAAIAFDTGRLVQPDRGFNGGSHYCLTAR